MILVDSNIIFSALIKDSLTRKIILEYAGVFLVPEYAFYELENHMDELILKAKMDRKELHIILQMILKKISIIPPEVSIPHAKEALEIMENVDFNDAFLIASALAYPGTIIWSNDRHLKKQSRIKVFSTNEIALKIH